MNVRLLLILTLLLSAIAAADNAESDLDAIGRVIDDFHDAAAHGDKLRYLDHLTEDAVFMGTDEWERWPKQPEFSDYVDGRFNNGSGWNYKSVERTIRIAELADIAWFDDAFSRYLPSPSATSATTNTTKDLEESLSATKGVNVADMKDSKSNEINDVADVADRNGETGEKGLWEAKV